MRNLNSLWALIKTDLVRARSTLPDDAAGHEAIHHYQDFLDHNELELACDMLELYAEDHRISRGFWLALRDAAVKMELPRATRYEAYAKSAIV